MPRLPLRSLASRMIPAGLRPAVKERLGTLSNSIKGVHAKAGSRFASGLAHAAGTTNPARSAEDNPLRRYFESNRGPGIFKWEHYFDVYHRHLQKFVGKSPTVLEIGVANGGSLGMWIGYFGAGTRVWGVDIFPESKKFESSHEGVKVLIGDQADRAFWGKARDEMPPLDIIIDDGGHEPHQQVATLEETLSHLKPGGVYVCEDIHGASNAFTQYVGGLARHLHAGSPATLPIPGQPSGLTVPASPLQSRIASVHSYPFVVVLETYPTPVTDFNAVKRGTEWVRGWDD